MSEKGTVLYRGETPGAIGFDIHGGYGRTWTTDHEDALAYARGPHGILKKAILPETAKRLIIVDPVTNEYNWEHIAELERLTETPYIAIKLRQYHFIFDMWNDEWTLAIIRAGYDSIATVGLDGVEEYVLNPDVLRGVQVT